MPELETYEIALPGTPPSFNKVGHSGNRWTWTNTKKQWEGYCVVALLSAPVPKKLSFVRANAWLFFKQERRRDEGNYRTLLEKCLGDALQLGWLEDDDPEHFVFDRVRFRKATKPTTIVRLEVTR